MSGSVASLKMLEMEMTPRTSFFFVKFSFFVSHFRNKNPNFFQVELKLPTPQNHNLALIGPNHIQLGT